MTLYTVIGSLIAFISLSILTILLLRSIRDQIAAGLWSLSDAIGKMAKSGELPPDIKISLDSLDSRMNDLRDLTEKRYMRISQIENRRKKREALEQVEEDDGELYQEPIDPQQMDIEDIETPAPFAGNGRATKYPKLVRIEK